MDMQMCLEDGKDHNRGGDQEEVEEEVVMHISGDGEEVMEMAPGQSIASQSPIKTTDPEEEAVNDHSEIDESGRIEETHEEVIVEVVEVQTENKVQKKKETKSYPCQKCGLVSSSTANLKKHMMTHTGEKPFKCRSCLKSFRQQHHLVDHWRIHSGERPFKCEVCGKHFVQRSSLNLHKKRHLSIKPYSCSECDYGTYQKTHLRIHMRTHTGEKPYQCEKCGQTFSNSTRLKYHHMIHTGERRFKCEQCGVPFREKVTLQAHMAVHLNVGPFVCEECGQEFPRLAGLSLHRRVHMNKDNYLYVHDKEAYKTFNSALQKASSKVNPLKRKRAQEIRKSLKSFGESDTDDAGEGDEPTFITSEVIGDTMTSKCHQTPDTSAKAPDTFMLSLAPEDKASPGSKLNLCPGNSDQNKLKEDLASSLEQNVQNNDAAVNPEQVREALKKGTVLETHSDNGKGFFIVLPPALQNKDIMVLSDPSESTTTTAIHIPDSGGTLEDRGMSPNILTESVLETDKVPYLSVEKGMEECDMDSVAMEEEDCSEDEEMMLQCEIQSAESILNTSDPDRSLELESMGKYSEAIEQLHPDGTSLLLWKDTSSSRLTKVIYIMEEGKEPIVVEEECSPKLKDDMPAGKAKRQKLKGSENLLKKNEKSNSLGAGKCINILKNSKITNAKTPKVYNSEQYTKSQRIYSCEQCGKTCKNSSNYIAHLRIHSGERPYYCGVCKMGFKQISHLKSHIRIHTGERPYACDLCKAAFTQSSRLTAHKKSVHPNGQVEIKEKKKKYVPENRIKNFFCRYCNKTFIGECLKVDHMKLHQPLFPFMCKICGMQSKTKSTMLNHILKHSDFKHVCELCGIELLSIDELQKHKVADHGISIPNSDMVDMYINVKVGDEKDFVILNPAVKGDKGNELATHIKSEISEDYNPGFCEIKQEIIHVTDVNGDVKSEILEMPSTRNEDEVAIHDITHTPPEKGKKKTPKKGKAKAVKNQPNEISSPPDGSHKIIREGEFKDKKFIAYIDVTGKKVWMCKVCDRSFTQSSNLYCHMRMHTGDKPYQCNVCPKAFRQITHLKDHMRRHTGAKPHKCSACSKCFTQRSAARRHIMVVHGGEAETERIPESQMAREIINTLSNERGLHSRGARKTVLKRKDGTPQDGKSYKLPQKENVLHICKVCNKQFPHSVGLTAHSRRCGKHKNWRSSLLQEKCTECGERFALPTQLLKHQQTCTAQDGETSSAEIKRSGKYKKKITSRSGCEEDSVQDNENTKFQMKKLSVCNSEARRKYFPCKQCGEVLSSVTLLKEHMEGHSGEMQQVCTMCGEVFKRASALRYHQSMKHGKEDRRYKDYCPTSYISVKEELIEEEMEEFLEESESEYEEINNWAYTEDDEEMVSDVRVNTKVTPKKKVTNNSVTKQKKTNRGALKTISNKVGKSTDDGKDSSTDCIEMAENGTYPCVECGVEFTRSSKLKHHKALWCSGHHGPHNADDNDKSLQENSPSKVNKVNREVETQKIVIGSNNNEKQESSECESDGASASTAVDSKGGAKQSDVTLHCEDCDKYFPDKHSFDEHLPIHEADRPFKCEHCSMRFKRKAHMFNHYRRHVSLAGVECL